MDELKILNRVLPGLKYGSEVVLPPGDDCAAIRQTPGMLLLAAVDQLAENVHYLHSGTTAGEAGAKLLKRNLSDIAAMGGIPRHCLIALAADKNRSDQWICDFLSGAAGAAEKYNVSLVGGDLCALTAAAGGDGVGLVASLTILGEVEAERLCRRDRLEAGDGIYVTGCFGNSYRSRHHLDFEPRLREGRFISGRYSRCMMDVSDGLALDLRRMLISSGLCARVDERAIPLREGADPAAAWSDGEDYELLFSVPAAAEEEFLSAWPGAGGGFAPVSRIGTAVAPETDENGNRKAGMIYDLSGKEIKLEHWGYEHK